MRITMGHHPRSRWVIVQNAYTLRRHFEQAKAVRKRGCLFPDSPFCNFMVFIVLYQILFPPISVIVSHTFLFCLADQFSDQDYNKNNNYKEEQADQHDHY